MTATARNGKIISAGQSTNQSSGDIADSEFRFSNLKLEDVIEFAFQTRPYEKVTFKNVALRPDINDGIRKTRPLTNKEKIKIKDKWISVIASPINGNGRYLYPDEGITLKEFLEAADYKKEKMDEAYIEVVRQIHQKNDAYKFYSRNLEALFNGKETDIALQPRDAVVGGYVGPSPNAEEFWRPYHFTDVIELTINDDSEEANMFADLDTGTLLTPPMALNAENEKAIIQWVEENGVDVTAETNDAVRGLISFHMNAVLQVDDFLWEADKIEITDRLYAKAPDRWKVLSAENHQPTTYLIETSEYKLGVLQILEVTENPKAVKIRYKLLEKEEDWGEPVMGLQTRLWSDKRVWPNNETPTLNFATRNIGKPERTIIDDETFISLVVTIDGQWRKELKQYVGSTDRGDLVTNERYDGQPITLDGNWESTISQDPNPTPLPLKLSPGKHIVQLEIIAPHPVRSKPPLHILSNSLEIDILPEETSTNSELKTTNYTATLPNGVTVELLGICEHPSEGKQWWKPDGSILNNRPYKMLSRTSRDENYKLYELLYHVSGLENADKLVRIELNDTVKGQSGSTLLSADADWVLWPKVDYCYSAIILCAPQIESGDIALLIGSDLLWETDTSIEAIEGSTIANTSTNGPNAMIAAPIEKEDRVFVNISHNVTDQQVRAIAVDKSGNIHHPAGTDAMFVPSKGMGMMEIEFDLPVADIQSIQFQTQKFQPLTFKNVSLRPGNQTAVEIEVRGAGASPQSSEKKVVVTGKLEFRAAANLNAKQAGEVDWPISDLDGYIWVQIEDAANANNLLPVRRIENERYLLVSDKPSEVMLADGSWGLVDVKAKPDSKNEHWGILATFDKNGSEKFHSLTQKNLKRHIAIVVDGKVLSAPQVMMPLSKQAIITGNLTKERAEELVKTLQKGVSTKPLRPGGEREAPSKVDKQKVYLPDLESKGVKTVLDLASGQMLSAEGMGKDRQHFKKLGKGDLVYEYAQNKSGLLCLRGATMQVRSDSGLQPTTPEVQRAAFDVYFLKQVPCQYQVTTAEGHKYEIKILSIK
ncbi:MAG: SecDF P1 head subdomain-containing protein, partial [Planctomycetota bacterium]